MERTPTEITEEGTYWLRSKHVCDSPAIGGDQYFSEHDVTPPTEVSEADLPPTDDDAVAELDRKALERGKTIGKWQVTGSADRIDELWPELVADAADGIVWAAKAMTAYGFEELPYDDYMIVVYTPNYFAKHDVDRVRDHLRDEYGVTRELLYKPDVYTAEGVVPENVEEFGLSMPARYRA